MASALAEGDRMTVVTDARNASLGDLAALLKDQHARKVDIVAPAAKIRSMEGVLQIAGAEAVLDESGVTQVDGQYRPTIVCDEGLSDKMGIPLPYMRRLRSERVDLLDANVNGWLHGRKPKIVKRSTPEIQAAYLAGTGSQPFEERVVREAVPGDTRQFLIRCFKPDDGESEGIARAFLSDRYSVIDNLDVLTAALDGVRQAGVNVEIDGCDLTDRKMYVRIVAPEVQALAPVLLAGYRNPFSDPDVERARNHGWNLEAARAAAAREGLGFGDDEGGEPVVFAGFVLSNSEVGGGAFSIVPRLMVKVCKNGLVITKDALRAVHLGGKMEEGVIRWTEDTQSKNIALVTAKTRDAVATFLDSEYMVGALRAIEEQAGVRVSDPVETVKILGKRLTFDQATIDGVLDHFVRGGQMTAGGVLQAVTSFAQTIPDADKAMDVEAQALRALEFAASL